MFVAGDEFARTQHGNNNPYNQDNETSWIDWCRRDDFLAHEAFVARLLAFRAAHPIVSSEPTWWGDRVEWFGCRGPPDTSGTSRTLAWHLPGLYVMANMWWEPLDFEVQVPGRWCAFDRHGRADRLRRPSSESAIAGPTVRVQGRSIVVLVPAE